MSESEYSVEQEVSEDEFEVQEKPRPKLRPSYRQKNYQAMHQEPKPTQEKRQTRGIHNKFSDQIISMHMHEREKDSNYHENYGSEDEEPNQPKEEEDEFSIFNIEIAQILWRRKRQNTQEDEYLIKLKGRSYLHTQWSTELEIEDLGKNIKNKINRFNKMFNQKLIEGNFDEEAIEEEKYFDSSYLEVDRIIMATEMFPVIHQKKANEIKGKWSESLMLVCSKLLNFTKNNIHYGVLFCEPVDPVRDNCPDYLKIITQMMDLGTILNKIYLDLYKNSAEFWLDIGLVWKNCLNFNKEITSDLHILGLTLRECTIFLYDQWFHLTEKRYDLLREEVGTFEIEEKNLDKSSTDKGGASNITDSFKMKDEQEQGVEKVKEEGLERIKEEEIKSEDQNISDKKAEENNIELNHAANSQKEKEGEDQQKQYENLNSENEDEDEEKIGEEEKIDEESDSKKKSEEDDKQKMNEEEKDVLNMEEFHNKNIFLTDKKVEVPTTKEQLEILNPEAFSYQWLMEPNQSWKHLLEYSYEYIDLGDMKKLDLNVEADRLYMVKWKNLSYAEATWELQSVISCPQKINQFKHMNKALGKEARTAMDLQREKHRALIEIESNPKKKMKYSIQAINEIKNKLYFYDVSQKKEPFQYKPETAQIYKNYKMLRSYQLESLNWLIKSWYEKRNTILADEMGLGKTIQSIAFLYHLFTMQNVKGPFLIIAPLSTLEHWKRTVEEWTNMNCILYYDQNGQPGRRSIQYYEWHHLNITMRGITVPSQLNKFQILITSYEVFLLDFMDVIMNLPIQFIVVDEAHRLKNKNAKILSALKSLPCKRVLLLTGTPIQNNTGELWSLLNYIHPQKFSSSEDFKRNFGDLSSNEQVERLNKILKPYMLRRMKEDVEQSIPPLQETIIDVEMTNIQKTIYKALYQKNKDMLIKGLASSSSCNTNLNNLEIQLRKCCNHPFLIKELESDLLKNCATMEEKMDKLLSSSGKMVLVKKLLDKCKAEGKKVLIFSQFTHMLQLIEQFLKWKQFKYERIDGQIKAKQRQSAIDRYNNPNKKRDVFLLSTKAGGVGINLTSANVVIIYDSDWNPQNDVQATARAHRIGQKSQVQVYRLITCNTYETQMFQRATQKLGLDKAIFIGGSFKEAGQTNPNPQNKLSKNQMETLLKKGILGFLGTGQPDHDAEEFFRQDVQAIIEKNSKIAKYSLINGSCSFSKSRFVSENSDNQLKINDPNFWNIVLKNVQSPVQNLLKKLKNNEYVKTLESQKVLMWEISEQMNILIENKLTRNSLNAEDQISLSEVLTIINSERHFNKFYRDLASSWIEEIYKPSRRFKKLTIEDLIIPTKGAVKKTVNTRGYEEAAGDHIYADEQEEEEDGSEEKIKMDDAKKQEMLKKLCTLCDKPKCTFYCEGFCKRAFHEECRKKFEDQSIFVFENVHGKLDCPELAQDNETLKAIAHMNWTCIDCQNNLVQCLVCKNKGLYYGAQYKKHKKGKSAKKDFSQEHEDLNSSKNFKKKNQVTKCSTANCPKYFHPRCIEDYDTKKLFKYIDVNSLHFRCSLHYCNICGISGDTMSIFQCVRCPKALHTRCMDKQKIVKLSKKQFICDSHFKNKKDLKKAQQRFAVPAVTIKKFLKAEKVESKRKEKQESEEQKVEEEVQHNYSTRRNKHTTEQIMEPVVVCYEENKRLIKTKDKAPTLTYEDLGLTPIKEFDYRNYDKDWCRYCGSRYSSNFTQGPWGSKTLCTVHYISWKQTKTLSLNQFTEKPQVPIDIQNDQELKFLSGYALRRHELSLSEIIPSLEMKKVQKKLI